MGKQLTSWNPLLWFTFLGFLRPAIHIFLLPLYLVKISPAEYGILSLVLIFASLIVSLSGFKLDVAANTFYYDYYQDRKKLKNYLGQVFSLNLLVGILFFLVLYFSGNTLFNLIFTSEKVSFFPFGILAVGNALISSVNTIYYAYLKNELRIKEFVGVNVFVIISNIALQALFILQFEWGILGILYGLLIPNILVFLFTIIKNSWFVKIKLNMKLLKPSLVFGLGFLPISFLLIFEKQIDRIFIERYLDLEQVGIYSLLLSVTGFFVIFHTAYQNAIRPNLYKALKQKEANLAAQLNEVFLQYCSIGLFALAAVFCAGNHFHLLTDNPKYLMIVKYIPYTIIASIPLIIIRFQILIVLFYKKTFHLSMSTIFKTLAMILVMFFLIPKYGINGAILALSISYLLYLISLNYVLRRVDTHALSYFNAFLRALPLILLVVINVLIVPEQWRSLSSIIIFMITSCIIIATEKTVFQKALHSLRKSFL